ncbi:hypothetical protein BASA81_009068 [Batrachochytrium salamandrivorans]|nr:hypothetical protein BASA81_009068 [Batrachochytrium salamandrivorans]
MIDFVEDLTSALSLATNGVGPQGLRVGLTWFSCLNNVPVTKQFVSPASGDQNVLAAAFAKLQSIQPAGGTCPSEGLQGIYNDIATTTEMTRPKAVLLMTDGLIEDSDSKKALQQGTNIRNLGAMFFTLSVGSGNLKAADKTKQNTQLSSLAGGEADRMFAADDAASLEKVVTIISALTFNSFQASFSPEAMDSAFCFSPKAKIVLNGPSVDYIDFGVDYFLHCNFGSSLEETIATRSNGVLACLVPDSAFPLSVLPGSPPSLVRTLQVGLVLVASNGERRALKFSKKLSLVLGNACFNPVLTQDCTANTQQVSFQLANVTGVAPWDVSCRFSFAAQSVYPSVPVQVVLGESVLATTMDNGKTYVCQVDGNEQFGLASAVDVSMSADKQITAFPLDTLTTGATCQTSAVEFDGNGCYGANLQFSFQGKNLTDSTCYFRSDADASGISVSSSEIGYQPLRMSNSTGQCLMPVRLQRTPGVVVVANSQGLIQSQIKYSGVPPAFASSDACVRLLAVLGAGGCQHFTNKKELIQLQFSSPSVLEGFVCNFGDKGTTPIVAESTYWTCEYLAPSVTIASKDGWVVSTMSGISIPASEVCASFYLNGASELCWGGKAAAEVMVQGESLNGAVGLECVIQFQNKQYISPLVLESDTAGTCFLPIVYDSVGMDKLAVSLEVASDLKNTVLASHVFPSIQVKTCSTANMTNTACSQIQVDFELITIAQQQGLGDLFCMFSNSVSTQTITSKLSLATGQCALPMSTSSKMELVGNVGATQIVIGEFDLDVSHCSLRITTKQSTVCYGSMASVVVEFDVKPNVQYTCQFGDVGSGAVSNAVVQAGGLVCSFVFYGPLSIAGLYLSIPQATSAVVDLTGMFALDTANSKCMSAVTVKPQCNSELQREVMLSGTVLDAIMAQDKLPKLHCLYVSKQQVRVITVVIAETNTGVIACSTPGLDTEYSMSLVLTTDMNDAILYTMPTTVPLCDTVAPTTTQPTLLPTTGRPTSSPTLAPTLVGQLPATFTPSTSPTIMLQPTSSPSVSLTGEPTESPLIHDKDGVEVLFTDAPTTYSPTTTVLVPVSNQASQSDNSVGGMVAAIIIVLLLLALCCFFGMRHQRKYNKRRAGEMVIVGDDLEKQTPRKPTNRFKLKQSPAITNIMPATLQPVRTPVFTEDDNVAPQDDILETIDVDPKPFELGQFLTDSLLPAGLVARMRQHNAPGNELANVEQTSVEEALTEVSLIGPDLVRVVVHHTGHREGLGLSLGRTADGTLLVDTFLRNGKSTAGPLESCGAIWAGDVLLEVNDINVQGWSLKDCAGVIRKQRALKGMREITFVFKTKNRNLLLGYGAYQITVPRGLIDLGLVFERNDRLVVVHKNKLAPLRNVVTLGSRLTAVDGVPVGTLQELRSRTSLDGYFNVPTVRLRFESPTNPIALKAAKVGDSFREGRTGIKSAAATASSMSTTAYVL